LAALLSVRPVNSSAALAAIIHDVGRSSRHDADVAGCQLGPAKWNLCLGPLTFL